MTSESEVAEVVQAAEDIAQEVADKIDEYGDEPAIAVAAGFLAPTFALLAELEERQTNLALKLMHAMLKARDINVKLANLGYIDEDPDPKEAN